MVLTQLQSVKEIPIRPWTRRHPNVKMHLFYGQSTGMGYRKAQL